MDIFFYGTFYKQKSFASEELIFREKETDLGRSIKTAHSKPKETQGSKS